MNFKPTYVKTESVKSKVKEELKLEAGKTYRLIDKEGYISNYRHNKTFIEKYFDDLEVTLDSVHLSCCGVVDKCTIITPEEMRFFELVGDVDRGEEIVMEKKTFKLIDKQGFVNKYYSNYTIFLECFSEDGEVVVDSIDNNGDGYLGCRLVIGRDEWKFFEEVTNHVEGVTDEPITALYNSKDRKVSYSNGTEEYFFTGEREVDAIASALIDMRKGTVNLQETYLILKALTDK